MPRPAVPDEELCSASCCGPFSLAELTKPVEFRGDPVYGEPDRSAFCSWPFFGLLLLENQTSDARDHCANERTFLAYLRLSVYMAIVAVAIVLSFHLRSEPSPLELKIAKPLGITLWVLAVACLMVGLGNYIQTVNKYARKAAIVQSGWVTQSIMTLIALSIICTCVIMLVIARVEVAG